MLIVIGLVLAALGGVIVEVISENFLSAEEGKGKICAGGFEIFLGLLFQMMVKFDMFEAFWGGDFADTELTGTGFVYQFLGIGLIAIGIVKIISSCYDLISETKKNQEKNSIEDTKE